MGPKEPTEESAFAIFSICDINIIGIKTLGESYCMIEYVLHRIVNVNAINVLRLSTISLIISFSKIKWDKIRKNK